MIRYSLASIALMSFSAPATADTLQEAIETAYITNPQLAAARAFQQGREEAPEQARALGRPTASVGATVSHDQAGYGQSAIAAVQFDLPIWTGGRTTSAVQRAVYDVAAGAEELRDAEALILQDVIAAYANSQYTQQAVQLGRASIQRLEGQVAEARARFDLGESTRTDVAQLESQRAAVMAGQAQAEADLAIAAVAYRALVGRDAGALSAVVGSPRGLPRTLADARAEAERSSPKLGQQNYRARAAASQVDQVRSEFAPAIDLSATYGRGRRLIEGELRGFNSAGSVGLTMRLPLLTGGLNSSRLRQAQASLRGERFRSDATLRDVIRAADNSWFLLVAAEARVSASAEGLAAAELALRGVRLEYSLGLRSTLDILVADQNFRAAQLAVARANADVLIFQAGLLRAIGRLGPDAFMLT